MKRRTNNLPTMMKRTATAVLYMCIGVMVPLAIALVGQEVPKP